jgi:diacylglycerol O-acyltransferase / wax synthase
VVTNIPGPPRPVYLAGTPRGGSSYGPPRSGRVAMSVTIFSYAGEITVGLAVDAGLIPDPERIVTAFESELEALLRLKPQPAG